MYINLEIVSDVHLVLAGIWVLLLIVIDPVLKRSRPKMSVKGIIIDQNNKIIRKEGKIYCQIDFGNGT